MRVWTIPNLLTLLRIVLIPFFILAYWLPFEHHLEVSAGIFLFAALTDWLDGFLARCLKQNSRFGEFLDPVADKLMVISALVLLISSYANYWMAIAGVVIISREIAISALREWMAEIGKRASVKVSMIGKVKTTVQMLALLILIAQPVGYTLYTILGFILLYAAVVLTLWSMVLYLSAAKKSIEQAG